jgi:membrane associated rhomboid family serine protease
MQQASVGFHCPECTKRSGQKIVRASQLRRTAVLTNVLIALNVAVFVAGLGSGLGTKDSFIYGGGLLGEGRMLDGIPIRPELVGLGELVGVAHGEWWRIVTSGFLHANLIHVGMNMLVLYQLGNLLEPALGKLRFGLVYLVSLLAGGLGVLVLDPNRFTVGASGAVFGLMGAAVAAMRARGIDPFASGLGGTIVLNLVFTFAIPGISIGGHVGGLIGGFLAGHLLLDVGPRYLKDPNVILGATAALGVALLGAGILVV